MRAPSAAALLDVWEVGYNQPPPHQALLLLMAAEPETAPEHLANLSVGRRDAALLTLREWLFGPRLSGLATCPACHEQLEMEFDVADLRVGPGAEESSKRMELPVAVGKRTFWFRVPNSIDLISVLETVQGDDEIERGRRDLLKRCLLRVDEESASSADLPDVDTLDEAAIASVESAIAEADPQADLQLELTCPACGHLWELGFDVVGYVWGEIDNWARRLLRDVHLLASAYGWHESDILALSPQRRRIYLSLLNT